MWREPRRDLGELHERPVRDAWVDERLSPFRAAVVDPEYLEACTLRCGDGCFDVRDLEGDVVEATGRVAVEELVEERRSRYRLEQLHLRSVGEPEVQRAVAELFVRRSVLEPAAERVPVEREQVAEPVRRVRDVVEGRLEADAGGGGGQTESSVFSASAWIPVWVVGSEPIPTGLSPLPTSTRRSIRQPSG